MTSALFHFFLCKIVQTNPFLFPSSQHSSKRTEHYSPGVKNVLAPPMNFLPTNLCREKRVTYQQQKVSHSFSCSVTCYVADSSGCHSWHLSNLLAAACYERTQPHPAATSENTFKESMQTTRNHRTKRAIIYMHAKGKWAA